jgi:hypothetical protein
MLAFEKGPAVIARSVCAATLCVFFGGCDARIFQQGVGGTKGMCATIDSSMVRCTRFADSGGTFVLWYDLAGYSVVDKGAAHEGGRFDGSVQYGIRHFAWQCATSDAKSGTMTIDGRSFELAAGTLFLVSTSGGTVAVTQLNRDLTGISLDPGTFMTLAKNDSLIRSFVLAANETIEKPRNCFAQFEIVR